MNSVITSFNRNNSKIIKIHSFCQDMERYAPYATLAKICFMLKTFILKKTNNDKYQILLMYMFY